MSLSFNYQPIFTVNPILITKTFNPDVADPVEDPDSWLTNSTVYQVVNDQVLIERITIMSCGDNIVNPNVTNKLVYVYFYKYTDGAYSLYKVFDMPANTITHTTPNAKYELTFTGGILLNVSDKIIVASSFDATGLPADYLAVTIEGSVYNLGG